MRGSSKRERERESARSSLHVPLGILAWIRDENIGIARHQRSCASGARPDYGEIHFRDIRRDGRFL